MAEKEETECKLHPRLRVVKNGSRPVNATRSASGTTVACSASTQQIKATRVHEQFTQRTVQPNWSHHIIAPDLVASDEVKAPGEPKELPLRPKLVEEEQAYDSYVNVFIELFHDRARGAAADNVDALNRLEAMIKAELAKAPKGLRGNVTKRRNMLSATVPVTFLDTLHRDPAVAFLHPAEPLKFQIPTPLGTTSKPARREIAGKDKHADGTEVLIGIIDVGGFDFAHPDFLNEDGTTRFEAIWDQGSTFRKPPDGFDYGSELKAKHLNAALTAAERPGSLPATLLEQQSQMAPGSHGTHVASIAAGKEGGVCPAAKIAAVLIDVPMPTDDVARKRWTFSDTSRITHAVEYLLRIAGNRPISINISLGTNGGAHDGSSGVSRWLDAYLAAPGRAICVAAGNAGQEAPLSDDDFGWMMGRIHTSGRVPARGLEVELEWTVVGNGREDHSENELEIWYRPQDRLIVHVKPPNGDWIVVKPLRFVENHRLPSGTTLSIYNELYHPTNGANYIAVYLSPNFDPKPELYRGIETGVWRIRLQGEEIRDGSFDAWIERDDPGEIAPIAGRRLFRFPSFFTAKSNVDSHSISSLACGHRVIAVANLDDQRLRINASSSQGPTRDGRCKPEIAARGTNVVAANGFADEKWVAMTGTSMASPYVAGVVGLMLAANKELTSAQCAGILQRTARPLPGASYSWLNDVGYGRLDPDAAVLEALTINTRKPEELP